MQLVLFLLSFLFYAPLLLGAKFLKDLEVQILSVPCERFVEKGDKIRMFYSGRLRDNGHEFDSNMKETPIEVTVGSGQLFRGWDQGLLGACEGERRRLAIPASLGHGSKGYEDIIPPFADLEIDVEVVSIDKKASKAKTKLEF